MTFSLHSVWNGILACWNDFFHARTEMIATSVNMRRAYAVVVLINFCLLLREWKLLFQYILPTSVARQTIDPDTWSIFSWTGDWLIVPGMYMTMGHLLLLLHGKLYPQFQAFMIYFWQIQFHSQNNQLWNGEDNVMRILGFLLIFWPPAHGAKSWPMWPFRLVQIQMCLIFFSSGGLKRVGESWRDGTALYRVTQHDILYGGWFNPDWIFGYTRPLMFLTYATQVLELTSIVTLWFEETRLSTLVSVWVFHASIDASMNLNMFHWIMIVGWSSFLVQPTDKSKRLSLRRMYNFVIQYPHQQQESEKEE